MKRIYGAFAILIALAILMLSGAYFAQKTSAEMQQSLQECLSAYQSADYSQAKVLAFKLSQLYAKAFVWLRLFVRWELLEEIGCNIKGLPAFISVQRFHSYRAVTLVGNFIRLLLLNDIPDGPAFA